MHVSMDSHVGAVRQNNEDAGGVIPIGEDGFVLAVADGLGGHSRGEVASSLAVESLKLQMQEQKRTFLEALRNQDQDEVFAMLRRAVALANEQIYKQAQEREVDRMGTTLVLAAVYQHRGYIVNVGDSRCYHLSASEGKRGLCQATRDHSIVQELLDLGEITKQEAVKHPQRNMITRAVGIGPFVDADIYYLELAQGDQLLLCSDGLSSMVSDEEIEQVLKAEASPKDRVSHLIQAALRSGGKDNITVICAEIDEV